MGQFKIGDIVTCIKTSGVLHGIGIVKEADSETSIDFYAYLFIEGDKITSCRTNFYGGSARLATDDERKLFLDKFITIVR